MITSFSINTCIIHRITLIDNKICYKCEQSKLKPSKPLEQTINICNVCDAFIFRTTCETCFICNICFKANRMAGWCKFCNKIFCQNSLSIFYEKFPRACLKLIIAEDGNEFNMLNSCQDNEPFLLGIVLSYL